jgi:hypothetical protein
MAFENFEPRPHQCNVLSVALDGASVAAHKAVEAARYVAGLFSGDAANAPMTPATEPSIEGISTPIDESAALSMANTAMRNSMPGIPMFYSDRS